MSHCTGLDLPPSWCTSQVGGEPSWVHPYDESLWQRICLFPMIRHCCGRHHSHYCKLSLRQPISCLRSWAEGRHRMLHCFRSVKISSRQKKTSSLRQRESAKLF